MDMQVDIIEEPERECGQRHSGPTGVGLYLVGGGIPMHCGRLPFPLSACIHCGHQYEHSRGFTWINPEKMFSADKFPLLSSCDGACRYCPMGNLSIVGDKAGLMWVGRKFYKTPDDFRNEAFSHPNGVCKRINELPNDFIIGKHIVYLAHVDAVDVYLPDDDETVKAPGVFMSFKPQRLEGVIDSADYIPERAVKLKEKYGDAFRLVQIVSPESDEDDSENDDGDSSFLGISPREIDLMEQYP